MLTDWLSIVDDQLDDFAEVTSILALQGILERMECQAGRVVANELSIIIEGASYTRIDDVGRCRLKRLCEEFHSFCFDQLSCLLTQSDAVTARPSFNFETSTLVPEEITHAMPLSFSPHAAKEDWESTPVNWLPPQHTLRREGYWRNIAYQSNNGSMPLCARMARSAANDPSAWHVNHGRPEHGRLLYQHVLHLHRLRHVGIRGVGMLSTTFCWRCIRQSILASMRSNGVITQRPIINSTDY